MIILTKFQPLNSNTSKVENFNTRGEIICKLISPPKSKKFLSSLEFSNYDTCTSSQVHGAASPNYNFCEDFSPLCHVMIKCPGATTVRVNCTCLKRGGPGSFHPRGAFCQQQQDLLPHLHAVSSDGSGTKLLLIHFLTMLNPFHYVLKLKKVPKNFFLLDRLQVLQIPASVCPLHIDVI